MSASTSTVLLDARELKSRISRLTQQLGQRDLVVDEQRKTIAQLRAQLRESNAKLDGMVCGSCFGRREVTAGIPPVRLPCPRCVGPKVAAR